MRHPVKFNPVGEPRVDAGEDVVGLANPVRRGSIASTARVATRNKPKPSEDSQTWTAVVGESGKHHHHPNPLPHPVATWPARGDPHETKKRRITDRQVHPSSLFPPIDCRKRQQTLRNYNAALPRFPLKIQQRPGDAL